MKKTLLIGALAALGAFTGTLVLGSRLQAADEIRCRVNAEALMRDIAALQSKAIGPEDIQRLLKPKP